MFTDEMIQIQPNPFRIFFRILDVGEKVKVYIGKISSELKIVEDGYFVYWMFILFFLFHLLRIGLKFFIRKLFFSKLACCLKYKASTYAVHGAPTRLRGQMGTEVQPWPFLPSHLPWRAGVSAGRRNVYFFNVSLRSHFVFITRNHLFFFWSHCTTCGILVPQPGI